MFLVPSFQSRFIPVSRSLLTVPMDKCLRELITDQRWAKGPIDRSSDTDSIFRLYRTIQSVDVMFRFLNRLIVSVRFEFRFFNRPILFLGLNFRFCIGRLCRFVLSSDSLIVRSCFLVLSSDFCIGRLCRFVLSSDSLIVRSCSLFNLKFRFLCYSAKMDDISL